MFKFSIRDLLALTVIGAIACVPNILLGPADPYSQLLMAAFLFAFGGASFTAGRAIGRSSRFLG